MKRSIILIAAALLLGISAKAEIKFDPNMANDTFTKGDIVAYANFSLKNHYFGGNNWHKYSMPISLGAEYCILDNIIADKNGSIGVGGHLFGRTCTYDHGSGIYDTQQAFGVFARGAFHYQVITNLDTYAALDLGLGCNVLSGYGTQGDYKDSYTSFQYGIYLGGRYWFSNGIAAGLEVGTGYEFLHIGVAKKF